MNPDAAPPWQRIRDEYARKPILLGLERVRAVRERLGRRQPPTVIAVGGTNGKGSVCALLAAILRSAGYRVGVYTSPHLLSFHERIRVQGSDVEDRTLDAAFARVVACEGADALTQFEVDTLAALEILSDAHLDAAILEVGLGGRLDAVNEFDSDCAVITSVAIDHVEYLGTTREQIAFEKAGILRGGRIGVCADPQVPQAIRSHAREIGSELWCLGDEFSYALRPGGWDFQGVTGTRAALPLPALPGEFQLRNASAALAVLDALQQRLPVGTAAVRRGLTELRLPGRFQVVPGRPALILDVAHNPHAARALANNLAALPPCPRTFAVFGMLGDKDIDGVVQAMKEVIDVWLPGGLDVPRGASAAHLSLALAAAGVTAPSLAFATVQEALRHADLVAGETDRIVVFGSFHTVAEVMCARGLGCG